MMQSTILDRYGRRFGQQEQRETRPIDVVTNPVVDEICRRFTDWQNKKYTTKKGFYFSSFNCLKNLEYTSNDVRDFSIRVKDYEIRGFNTLGYFLSALIDKCPESNFEIITEFLAPRDCIGYKNRKNVVVRGDVGWFLGDAMRGGSIHVSGDAGDWVGLNMEGGEIEILGKVGSIADNKCKRCIIRVEGEMNTASLGLYGGRVYHRGNLIRGKE